MPIFFILMGMTWKPYLDRLLPAAFATLIVGLWPLYHWLTTGDLKTASIFLSIAGIVNAILVLNVALGAATRRGWIKPSPARRRAMVIAMLVVTAATIAGWPTGVWRSGLTVAWSAMVLWCLVWPVRRSQPGQAT